MKITYIHHSGFCAETETAVMLFDYYKGMIPLFDKKKHIFVFSSHKHQDHFNFEIFELAKIYPEITFILSSDIRMNKSYMDRKNIPESIRPNIHYINKNVIETYPINSNTEDGYPDLSPDDKSSSLLVETLTSTDEGVAFIVTINGKVIYHAGDLNWWSWEGETKEEYADMTDRFQKEIFKIKGRFFDAAFLPLDPRQEDRFWWGFDYFMKSTETVHAFPMHFWKDYTIISKLKNMEISKEYFNRIVDIKEEGQIFLI
ncbi:MBL fold metallo-hydrolase [Anaerocolumna sp. MB42-C2]|uniref:MBL fold metallo-hydrolase n=1 Tax=Anaerocolumna sp. MB42-C2 TaxID=3070997 RepID=UPI0027DEB05F|nr:MBL fold metallo-hydrolase [Anaerocolumna sp. MB42-C2]WMJ87361.1 MBL fold metallo-hydrolase [Anaerocolumna sp. MB42-C2]